LLATCRSSQVIGNPKAAARMHVAVKPSVLALINENSFIVNIVDDIVVISLITFIGIEMAPTITEAPINTADTIVGSVTFTYTAVGIPLPTITWSNHSNNSIVATSDAIIDFSTTQLVLTLSDLQDDDFERYTPVLPLTLWVVTMEQQFWEVS